MIDDIIKKNVIEISYLSDNKKIQAKLNKTFENTLKYFSENFFDNRSYSINPFTIGTVQKENRMRFAIDREKTEIIIANWLFDFQFRLQQYILYLIIVKESIQNFLPNIPEPILNILTVIFYCDQNNIKSIDDPVMASFSTHFYTENFGGRAFSYYIILLFLLISKQVPFKSILNEIVKISSTIEENEQIISQISAWIIENNINIEDTIAPIYLNERLFPIFEDLVQMNYQEFSVSEISKKTDLHPNTIRNRLKDLASTNNAFWRAVINFQKLKLNNYFLKIVVKKKKLSKKLLNYITQIDYLKSIYQSKYTNDIILYSPSLISPHIVVENLKRKLEKAHASNDIVNYDLQIIRERIHYTTITDYPFRNTIQQVERFLAGDTDHLHKYKLAHEKRDFSLEFDISMLDLDYKLLYFLSLLKGKFLLQARYIVEVSELPKFYEYNALDMTDLDAQTDLLSQLSIRAHRNDLLDFALFIRSFAKLSADVLVFEIPQESINEEIIEKLSVFSFLGQISLYDKTIFNIPGISHRSKLKDVLQKALLKEGIEPSFYTISLQQSRFIPFHELYDYENKKWL
ncbi:MAG: hypothetical protein U9O98_02530 [Asgard group archaeon]|nr:hypothetical protein [Asgard group archaeon]